MKVFVAGATGMIGRRLVPLLLEAGHDVTGMTRSQARAEALRSEGAEAVVCDAFDRDGLLDVVAEARPEVVVHELTDIPRGIDPRRMSDHLAGNDRLRIEGTRNLVEAAKLAGARRIVAQSVAFAYELGGVAKQEDDPLHLDAPMPWRRTVAAIDILEQTVLGSGLQSAILRYGWIYGPGSPFAADGSTAELVRKRRYPVVGFGEGRFSFVHVDDAARATVAAVEGCCSGVYNIVDEDPARVRDWLPVYADALGAPPPRRIPTFVARLLAGPLTADWMTRQAGASNLKAKAELGWEPRWPTWRKGFREGLG